MGLMIVARLSSGSTQILGHSDPRVVVRALASDAIRAVVEIRDWQDGRRASEGLIERLASSASADLHAGEN